MLCSCSSGEEKLNIPEGNLKRAIKTQEQKEKDLEVVMQSEMSNNLNVIYRIINTVTVFDEMKSVSQLIKWI